MKVSRRAFCAGAAAFTATGCMGDGGKSVAARGPWRPGHFQIHMIYTGTAESLFLVFPDGTSMLLDCGDSNPHTFFAKKFGPRELPILPSEECRAGEWIARYVQRMNPRGADVDYMFLSHFHGDHSGSFDCNAGVRHDRLPDGEPYYLSGFALAAETLRFRHAIDRGWPNYDDPLPYPKEERWMGGSLSLMKKVYRHLGQRDGLAVEKFRVGATDQLRMLHNPAAHPGFSVFNLCGNGKVAFGENNRIGELANNRMEGGEQQTDGTNVPNHSTIQSFGNSTISLYDVYGTEHPQHKTCVYNENAMSLGCVFTYGKFKFFTAGDFTASDGRKGTWQGQKTNIEKILAQACGPVSVAKANHHAGWSCPNELVAALRPRIWLAPVWWQLQADKGTMARLASRENYPGDRLLLPGVMCRERREADAGMAYLADVPEVAHTPSHVVIDVPPGGETYSVAFLDPTDESFRVKAKMKFAS